MCHRSSSERQHLLRLSGNVWRLGNSCFGLTFQAHLGHCLSHIALPRLRGILRDGLIYRKTDLVTHDKRSDRDTPCVAGMALCLSMTWRAVGSEMLK
jgi:hypothetical protein